MFLIRTRRGRRVGLQLPVLDVALVHDARKAMTGANIHKVGTLLAGYEGAVELAYKVAERGDHARAAYWTNKALEHKKALRAFLKKGRRARTRGDFRTGDLFAPPAPTPEQPDRILAVQAWRDPAQHKIPRKVRWHLWSGGDKALCGEELGTSEPLHQMEPELVPRGFGCQKCFGAAKSGRRAPDALHDLIETWGVTTDPNKSGFILPDGRMLDLSEGHPTQRMADHRAVTPVEYEQEHDSRTEALWAFMTDTGVIRMDTIMGEGWVGITLDLRSKLTRQQLGTVVRLLRLRPAWVRISTAADPNGSELAYPRLSDVLQLLDSPEESP